MKKISMNPKKTPTRLNEIQPLEWRIPIIPNDWYIYVYRFPTKWREVVEQAINLKKFKLRRKDFHTLFLAEFTDILFCNESGIFRENSNWLYSIQPLDEQKLSLLCQWWMSIEIKHISSDAEFWNQIFTWEKISISDLALWERKKILPPMLMKKLIQSNFLEPHDYSRGKLMISDNKWQWVTFPPYTNADGNLTYSHSHSIYLEAQSYNTNGARIILRDKIYRWFAKPLKKNGKSFLPWNERTTVMLKISDQWFQSYVKRDKENRVRWEDTLSSHLTKFDRSIPDLNDLLNRPDQYMDSVLIPFHNKFDVPQKDIHPIGPGLELANRTDYYFALTKFMTKLGFEQSPSWKKVKTQSRDLNEMNVIPEDKIIVGCFLNDPSVLLDQINNEFTELEKKYLEVLTFPIAEFQNPLSYIVDDKNQVLEYLLLEREKMIQSYLETYPQLNGAIIELTDYSKLSRRIDRLKDPKQAIRNGFAKSRVLTQFITPNESTDINDEPDKKYKQRTLSAIRDLIRRQNNFRQKSVIPIQKKSSVPRNLNVYSFSFLQNRVPVVLRVRSLSSSVEVFLPLQNGNRWLSYPEACLELSHQNLQFDPYLTQIFFQRACMEDHENSIGIYLVTQMRNKKIPIVSFLPSLRWASINFGNLGDSGVPRTCPPNGQEVSKYTALFSVPDINNLFISIQKNDHHIPAGVRQQDRITVPSWNAVETSIQLYNMKETDNLTDWAYLIHNLRISSEHISGYNRSPAPLCWAEHLEEYIIKYK